MLQLNPLDTAMLILESPKTPFHVSMINVYDPSTCPTKAPTFEDIVEAVGKSLPAAPTFRRKLVQVPLALDYPYWVEDEDFDLEFHMRHTALPRPGNWRQFQDLISRLIARPLDLSRPPWEMWVVEGLDNLPDLPPGCFATVLKIHHCAIDGETGVSMVSAIHQNSADEPLPVLEDTWEPEAVPGTLVLLQKAWINSIRHPVAIGKLLLSNAAALVRSAVTELRSDDDDRQQLAPATILNAPISGHRIIDEVRCKLDDVKRIRQLVAGATINDVSIAIVAEAMRRYLNAKGELPKDSLITCMPISTRTPGQTRAGSNQLTISRISLHTDIADPIKRLTAIAAETGKRKSIQNGVMMSVLLDVVHNLPGALVGAVGSVLPLVMANSKAATKLPFNTLVTNVPGPRTPIYFLGAKAVLMTGSMPLTDGGGLLHCVGGYNGSFNFTFTACRKLMPDADFYRECMETAIEVYIRAAGTAAARPKRKAKASEDRKS